MFINFWGGLRTKVRKKNYTRKNLKGFQFTDYAFVICDHKNKILKAKVSTSWVRICKWNSPLWKCKQLFEYQHLLHRYRKMKNRLLKFCYVPATSAAHNRLIFFLFLLQSFTVLMKQTRQAVRIIKQVYILRYLWFTLTYLVVKVVI